MAFCINQMNRGWANDWAIPIGVESEQLNRALQTKGQRELTGVQGRSRQQAWRLYEQLCNPLLIPISSHTI